MNYKKLIDGVFVDVDESQLNDGDRIQKKVVAGVWAEMNHYQPESANTVKEAAERQWRDSELSRTDQLVDLSDYPRNKTREEFKAYREAVATWDSNPNFPNCELRPKWEDKADELV